jgi:hypothetical protein
MADGEGHCQYCQTKCQRHAEQSDADIGESSGEYRAATPAKD